MRPLVLGCLAALLALVLAGCGPPARRTVDLVVWGTTLGPNDKGQADVFREFERQNPGVRVVTLSMGSGAMNPQKLMTAIVGRVPPDVVYQDRFTLADWASRGAFQPLDPLIRRDRPHDPRTPLPEQYFPGPWRESTFGGHVYGIPWMADDRVLFWNRTVFASKAEDLRRAGLDPNRGPRTWSELLAYSKVLTEFNRDGTLRRAGFIPAFGNSWFFLYASQNEAELLSRDGRHALLDSAAPVEAMTFVKACYDVLGGIENAEHYQATFRGEGRDAFFTGQVAMKVDGDWSLGGIAMYAPRLDFGSGPPPIPDARLARTGRFARVTNPWTTWAGGFAYCVPAGARHPELAWKFIKWVTSTEGRLMEVRRQDDLNRSRGQMTFPRLTAQRETNALTLREFLPKNPRLAEAVRWHFRLLPSAKVRPVSFASKLIWDECNRATEQVARGVATPQKALTEANGHVQQVLDEFYERARLPIADLRVAAWVGFAAFLIGATLLVGAHRRQPLGRLARRESLWGYLFVAPWVAGFLVFTLGPMVASAVLSFTQANGLQAPRWAGFQNYTDVLGKDQALVAKAFGNALYMAGLGVPLGLVTGLSIALLLNAVGRGRAFFRTVYYLPSVVPGVATVVLWTWILSPDPKLGLVNGIWSSTVGPWFGLPAPGWLASEDWAKPGIVLMGLWGAGAGVIVWLAGLKGIPRELYEAAEIDGARPVQQFWSVTLPHLSPLVFFNTVTGFIGALQVFDPVYVATSGESAGPNDSLLVPVYHLFQSAFGHFRMGYASALAWVVFAVVMGLTAVQFLLARRYVHYEVAD